MTSRTPAVLVLVALVLLLVLVSSRSRADDRLPGGVTCEQVVEYSRMLQIPNTTWGRAQARVVAATLGLRLTDAQLDAAAQCLRTASAR